MVYLVWNGWLLMSNWKDRGGRGCGLFHSTIAALDCTGKEKTVESAVEVTVSLATCDKVFLYYQSKSRSRFIGTARLKCGRVMQTNAATKHSLTDPNPSLQ
jgi:hypothetical protein